MSRLLLCILSTIATLGTAASLPAVDPPAKKIPVLVDTDIGNGLNDAYALADLLARPEIEIVGITTCVGDTGKRAQIVGRFLSAAKRREIPFAAGAAPQPAGEITYQHQYQYHPAVVYNRMGKAEKESAADFMAAKLKARPGEITILCLGPLTNVARLLADHPESKGQIKRIVISWYDSFLEGYKEVEELPHRQAIEAVFAAGVPIDLIVEPQAVMSIAVSYAQTLKLFDPPTLLSLQLESLGQMEAQAGSTRHYLPALVATATVAGDPAFPQKKRRVKFDGRNYVADAADGIEVRTTPGPELAINPTVESMKPFLARLQKQSEPAPRPELTNRAELVERGNFPARVHAFEDYETDIEKRWWMTGRLRTEDSAAGKFRYCQGILTQDFDDRQGNLDAMYNAVVFNPVPGPPMGPKTRLTFRYYLDGTDTLRVQLYSLSNGYHRYLTVTGLPQKEWREGTVDMTKMLRPDGTGGPLAADERIDDIQFYVDARATVKIDSMVLYDAADEKETRPFPKRLLFTGWFDTGKQGNEWPGTFEILPHEKPRSWKFAQSVPNEKLKKNWIRIDLRGPRPLGQWTHLIFDYRIEGPKDLEIRIVDANGKALAAGDSDIGQEAWGHEDFIFPTKPGAEAREIWFLVSPESKLQLDNLLLSELPAE